jgi:hypothetical protein
VRTRNMLRWWSVVLALSAITPAAHAQSVVRVLDRDSLPIPYALVQVGGGTERIADSLGRARFGKEIGAAPSLTVRRIGYAPFQGRATASPHGEFVVLLEPTVRELEAVQTVALRSTPLSRTGFYDRMQRVHDGAIVGRFITPEELEQRRPTLVSQVLQGLPSVRVQRAPDGRAVVLGRGGCPMTVLLDGQRLNGLLQDNKQFRNTSINPRGQYGGGGAGDLSLDQATVATEVMAIEVYNSTANAPSELIPTTGGGSCGLIAIWTGPRR